MHAKKILPHFRIPAEDQEVAKNLLHNQWIDGKDPLQVFIAHFQKKEGAFQGVKPQARAATIEAVMKAHIIDGSSDALEADLDEALRKYTPLEIINQLLLEGMKTVGELFGAGKMQLPSEKIWWTSS